MRHPNPVAGRFTTVCPVFQSHDEKSQSALGFQIVGALAPLERVPSSHRDATSSKATQRGEFGTDKAGADWNAIVFKMQFCKVMHHSNYAQQAPLLQGLSMIPYLPGISTVRASLTANPVNCRPRPRRETRRPDHGAITLKNSCGALVFVYEKLLPADMAVAALLQLLKSGLV